MSYEPILDEAKRLVYGPREAAYDHPRADFTRTVGMLNALFSHKLREPFAPADFGLLMICCKLSREVHRHKRDNLTDIAGYAETVGRVLEEEEESVPLTIGQPVQWRCGACGRILNEPTCVTCKVEEGP